MIMLLRSRKTYFITGKLSVIKEMNRNIVLASKTFSPFHPINLTMREKVRIRIDPLTLIVSDYFVVLTRNSCKSKFVRFNNIEL